MSELREYVVTLHNREDLDSFYEDMETPGGNLHIPDRAVVVANRRPVSRNTHYWLSDQEAAQLKGDSRVRAVELTAKERGIEFKPVWSQFSPFTKTFLAYSIDKNWGLLRCIQGEVIPGWGQNDVQTETALASYPIEGNHVDVVIVDGIIKEDHAEFKTNDDGSGSSKIVQFNWFSLNPEVTGDPVDDYAYADTDPLNADHGTHVAGIAVGNTQGWARKATIYNISPYGLNNVFGDTLFDYIRAWHNAKEVNPEIDAINPTICNNSWASFAYVTISDLNDLSGTVTVRGVTYSGPWTETGNGVKTWQELGFDDNQPFFFDGEYYLQVRAELVSTIADIEDCIDDGIHIVFAAGNDSRRHDVDGGLDVDNRIEVDGTTYYINRHTLLSGKESAAIQAVMDVGAIGANANEPLATFTNRGPAVDLFAPGEGIVSAIAQLSPEGDADDPRGLNDDRIKSQSGTSMAAPQVTGVMACLLELSPTISPADLKAFILEQATADLIDTSLATNNAYDDEYSLQGAPNLSLLAPTPTFTIDLDVTYVAPGDSVTATITTTNVPDQSSLYVFVNADAENFVGVTGTVLEVNSGTAEWTLTANVARTGEETFEIYVFTGGYNGSFQSNSATITLGGTYTFNTAPVSLEEGNTGNFNITTTGVANGTVLYWTVNHVTTSNNDFIETNGSFVIQNNAGSFSIETATDLNIENNEFFTVSVRTGSITGTVRVTTDNIILVNSVATFNNSVNTEGSGLWGAETIQSYFLRDRKSFTTNVDIRLPKVAFLTSNLNAFSNAEISVSNIELFPSPATITANSTAFANTVGANAATLSIVLSSVQGLSNGFKLVTANIPSAANSNIQRIFSNGRVIIENLPLNSNVVVTAGEPCYFYPKTFFYRNLKTVTANTALANVLVLTLESVDNISVGALASTANILSLTRDDTITTVKKVFLANNTVLIQNIDANLTVSAGEYVSFSTRPTVGAVRVKQEVIYYERLWAANSRLTNLTRNVGKTPNSAISSNVAAGHIVSVLGLQNVRS